MVYCICKRDVLRSVSCVQTQVCVFYGHFAHDVELPYLSAAAL